MHLDALQRLLRLQVHHGESVDDAQAVAFALDLAGLGEMPGAARRVRASTPQQVERYRKWKDRYFKSTVAHYKKYANIPNIDQEILDDGWFVPAKDCLKYSLADKFTDKFVL